MRKGSEFAREEPSRLQRSKGLKAAWVPGMSERGGVSPADCSWRQTGQGPQGTVPCSPIKVLAFYFRCHGKLLTVLNRGIAFSIFLWPPGEELNLEQKKGE